MVVLGLTLPCAAPTLSMTLKVLPVPVPLLSLVPVGSLTGLTGAAVSMLTGYSPVDGALGVVPAENLCTPLDRALVGVKLHLPSASTVVLPSATGVPVVLSKMVSTWPGTPVPLMVGRVSLVLPWAMSPAWPAYFCTRPVVLVTSSCTLVMAGAAGAATVLLPLSTAVLPMGSVAVAVMGPAGTALAGVTVQRPSGPAVAEPMTLPSLSLRTTSAPGSVVPLRGLVVPPVPAFSMLTWVLVSMVNGVAPMVVVTPALVALMTGVYTPSGSWSASGMVTA